MNISEVQVGGEAINVFKNVQKTLMKEQISSYKHMNSSIFNFKKKEEFALRK